jgi:HD-GYP domain-containing protein (c-di-GMP phosphodiesterase class II)
MPAPRKQSASPIGAKVEISEALGRIRGLEDEIAVVVLEMQEKVQQLEYLNQFSGQLNSSLDTETVRDKALEATCKLLRCESARLLLIDRAHAELSDGSEKSPRTPIDDRSIPGYVVMTGESLIVNDVANDPRNSQKSSKKGSVRSSARSMVCVPLKAKERTIGVLLAMDKLPRTTERAAQESARHDWPDFYGDDLRLLETLGNQVAVALENAQLYTAIKRNFFDTVEALAEAIEKKDRYTGGHTKRVTYYSMQICKYLGLDAAQCERIRLGAILHDVGKIGIEDKILKKESTLTETEWKVMQTHPELGFDIMSRVEGLKDVIGGMRYHHERWDGKGYPLGLKGEEIPLVARVVAVADTFDAMVSTRPYRKGMDPKAAFDEIVKNRGTQFDPTIVEAFVEAFRNEKMGKGSGGSSLSNCD